MKKRLLILICCFALVSLTSCGISAPGKTIEKYFSALNQLEFTKAGECLGDVHIYDHLTVMLQNNDSYLESTINSHFTGFIYSNLKCEIISAAENGTGCEIKTKITSYNIDDVIKTQQILIDEYTASSEYLNLNTGERYVRLCDQIDEVYKQMPKAVQPVVTETDIRLVQKDGKWTIVPTQELFAALAGGAENTP